jgi:hypothetical protein
VVVVVVVDELVVVVVELVVVVVGSKLLGIQLLGCVAATTGIPIVATSVISYGLSLLMLYVILLSSIKNIAQSHSNIEVTIVDPKLMYNSSVVVA